MEQEIKKYPILPLAFFEMPVDLEGSNIGETGYLPTMEDCYFDEGIFKAAEDDFTKKNEKVCFKNTVLEWDSCDCGDGYGCSHGSWVYQIIVTDATGRHTISEQDGDSLYFENEVTGKQACIPLPTSVGDFHRACTLVGIELELTDYALSIIEEAKKKDFLAMLKSANPERRPHTKYSEWVAAELKRFENFNS